MTAETNLAYVSVVTLAKRIREARVSRGLTQAAFAGRVRTTQAAVSQWETGMSTPGATRLRAISAALGIPIPELLSLSFESSRRKRKGAAA